MIFKLCSNNLNSKNFSISSWWSKGNLKDSFPFSLLVKNRERNRRKCWIYIYKKKKKILFVHLESSGFFGVLVRSLAHGRTVFRAGNINETTWRENKEANRVFRRQRSFRSPWHRSKGPESFDGWEFSGVGSAILFTRHAPRHSTNGIRSRLETCLPNVHRTPSVCRIQFRAPTRVIVRWNLWSTDGVKFSPVADSSLIEREYQVSHFLSLSLSLSLSLFLCIFLPIELRVLVSHIATYFAGKFHRCPRYTSIKNALRVISSCC